MVTISQTLMYLDFYPRCNTTKRVLNIFVNSEGSGKMVAFVQSRQNLCCSHIHEQHVCPEEAFEQEGLVQQIGDYVHVSAKLMK